MKPFLDQTIEHLFLADYRTKYNFEWPNYDTSFLEEEEINAVIQINGKKRALIKVKKDIKEADLLEITKKDKIVKKYLKNNNIKKIIFVKNKLLNILINE